MKYLAGAFWILIAIVLATGAECDAANAQELEEVIVTAQKREQDLQDVPSSVATIDDENLDYITATGTDIRVLSARTPSLYVESSFGRTFPRFYIRGLGNTDFDMNASQPVSLVYDEIVLENPILKGFPIFDLERVEVLRGPQGTLFGRNTPAGIVKFESRKPDFEFDAFGRLTYGRWDTIQFEGAVGGPITPDLAGRGSILYQGRSDWVDNTFTEETDTLEGYDEIAGRVQFLFAPGTRFTALLNVHGRDLDGTARLFRANMIEPGTDDIVDGFDVEKVAHDGMNTQKLDEIGGVARLDYELDQVTLTSVTGYESADIFSRGDIDGGYGAVFAPPTGPGEIPFPSETADAIPDLDQFTQEIRVTSNAWEETNFQAGFFYFWEDLNIETHSYATLAGGERDGFAKQRQKTNAWAVFGSVEHDVSEEFRITGGVRYSEDKKDFTAERTLSPIGGGELAPTSVDPEDAVWSWDFSGMYSVNREVNVYGRVARSFRAPSIQGRVLFGDVVSVGDTETILSAEAGVKTNLWRNRARANLSVFRYRMNDQQLTAVGGTQNFNTLLNADRTTGTGFELDLEVLPVKELLLTAGVSYNKTEIEDPNLGIVPGAAAGLTVLDDPLPGGGGAVSIDGNSLPNAPEWVINVTAQTGMPLGGAGEIFAHTDWSYRSQVHFFLYESKEFREANLVEGGVRVGYARYDGSYELAVFSRNVNDNLSRTGGIDFNNLTGFVNEPRTFGVELRARY